MTIIIIIIRCFIIIFVNIPLNLNIFSRASAVHVDIVLISFQEIIIIIILFFIILFVKSSSKIFKKKRIVDIKNH